jgi:hypothetical protein
MQVQIMRLPMYPRLDGDDEFMVWLGQTSLIYSSCFASLETWAKWQFNMKDALRSI